MYSPQSANVASPTVCNFDELESLRLESERFGADLQALKSQFRSHSHLHALVSRIGQKFATLCDSWNTHCETAIDKVQTERQRVVELQTGRSDSLSSSRRRVNLLELQEQEMEVKEKVLHNTLKNLTSLLRSDLEYAEQALEGQRLLRDMQSYDQKEMLHQVDDEVGDILGLGDSSVRVSDLPRQLVPHPPLQRPSAARPLRPSLPKPQVESYSSDEDSNVSEEFDKVMDELRREQPQDAGLEMSMEKSVGGWDSALESETSSPEASISPNKLKNALLILRKVNLLNNVRYMQNPDLLRQIEQVLNGPDVTQNLEVSATQLLLQAVKYNGKNKLPSDLACTTPKSFHPLEKFFDKTVLSTGRQLFAKEATGHDEKAALEKPDDEDNADMQWEDLMGESEAKGRPAAAMRSEEKPVPTPSSIGKTEAGKSGMSANFSSPRTMRFAQTYLSQQSRELNTKLSPAPLLDQEQSKFMYQLTKRSSTFSTKASSGLKSKMLKGSGDMALGSPYHHGQEL